MSDLIELFGDRSLTDSARRVLTEAGKLATSSPLDAGHVLLSVILLDDNYAISQRLHRMGFNETTSLTIASIHRGLLASGHEDDGYRSLQKMADEAVAVADERKHGSSILVSDLVIGAFESKSWLADEIRSKAGYSLNGVLHAIGAHPVRVLRAL